MKEKQHYVAKSYYKIFEIEKGSKEIYCVDKEKINTFSEMERAHVNHISRERFFYSTKEELENNPKGNLEEILGAEENKYIPIIKKINERLKRNIEIPIDFKDNIVNMLAIQYSRTKAYRKNFIEEIENRSLVQDYSKKEIIEMARGVFSEKLVKDLKLILEKKLNIFNATDSISDELLEREKEFIINVRKKMSEILATYGDRCDQENKIKVQKVSMYVYFFLQDSFGKNMNTEEQHRNIQNEIIKENFEGESENQKFSIKKWLKNKNYFIFKIPEDDKENFFIVSDNPIVTCELCGEKIKLGYPGLKSGILYFPLSPKACLFVINGKKINDEIKTISEITESNMKLINGLQISNAYLKIYSNQNNIEYIKKCNIFKKI